MSPVHSASLVDPALHSKALLELLDLDVTRNLTDYIARCTTDAVDYAISRSASTRAPPIPCPIKLASFTEFVSNVVRRSDTKLPVLLASLVYIRRAKPHICIQKPEWAYERVFLGAIILAAKYTNDCSLKNVHWASCTRIFGRRDVSRIEREVLEVLDWDLSISESDILYHHDCIIALYPPRPAPQHQHRHHSSTHHHSSHHHALSPPHCPPGVSDTYWNDSDSDSSMSSPETPSTSSPYRHPHIKSPFDEHTPSHHVYQPPLTQPHVFYEPPYQKRLVEKYNPLTWNSRTYSIVAPRLRI